MKSLPNSASSYKEIYAMALAPVRSHLLMTGLALGVFDHINHFRTASEIAAAIGTHKDNTRRFLNALTTTGLVEKKDGRYRNRDQAREFLAKRSPAYLGDLLKLVRQACLDPLDDLVSLLKNGPCNGPDTSAFSPIMDDADAARVSAAWVLGGVGTQMTAIISSLPEFPNLKRLMDLGGGHGMFALYFVSAHPTMTAVVFDRPAVAAVAHGYIVKYGLRDRVTVAAGDYLTDPLGAGYDLIWACSTLNAARHDLDALFLKILDALNPGGLFISFQEGLTHQQTRPDTMLGQVAHAMKMGHDLSFDQGEIADAMLRQGFRSVQSRTIGTAMGEMDLDIARK